MLPLTEFLERARSLGRQAFIAHYPGHFLLKRPSLSGERQATPSGFDFATIAAKVTQTRSLTNGASWRSPSALAIRFLSA